MAARDHRYGGTTCGGPNFALRMCVDRIPPEERESLDLSSWKVAFNGSEPVRAETLERFSDAFAPFGFRREAFYPCYGMAEATLLVAGGRGTNPLAWPRWTPAALEQHRSNRGAGRRSGPQGAGGLRVEPERITRSWSRIPGPGILPAGQVGEI